MPVEALGFVFPVAARFDGSLVISNLRSGLCWCQKQQLLPHQIQVHQRAHRKQLVGVLLQSSVTQLHKPGLRLHHRKHVLHFRAHRRLGPVLRPLHFVNTILVAIAPMGASPGPEARTPRSPALSAIGVLISRDELFPLA
jgi:hypothetical protein